MVVVPCEDEDEKINIPTKINFMQKLKLKLICFNPIHTASVFRYQFYLAGVYGFDYNWSHRSIYSNSRDEDDNTSNDQSLGYIGF